MLTDTQNKQLLEAVDLLHKADALIQKAMGASDECYYIHTQVENAADDVLDFLQEHNEDIDAE
jgi:hypothetical protein